MDNNNNNILQKIVGKFLYYAGAIDPTMLLAINSLAEVHIKPKIEAAKHITEFLNYSLTHPDTVTAYRISGMVIHIYLYESYISEPGAQSRDGGYIS